MMAAQECPSILVECVDASFSDAMVVAAEIQAFLQGISARPIALRRLMAGTGDPARDPAGHQHVSAAGGLMANGWLWAERLAGLAVDPSWEVSGPEPMVAGPQVFIGADMAVGATPAAIHVAVRARDNTIEAMQGMGEGAPPFVRWRYDAFARPQLVFGHPGILAGIGPADETASRAAWSPSSPIAARTVLLVGEDDHLRHVYPAVLAALGDAADGLRIAVRPRILSPRALTASEAEDAVRAADAIILPGGCDGSQVDGQILVAGAAFALKTPILGCCFGMQTMTVAYARTALDVPDAHMEEVAPDVRPLVFTGLRNAAGERRHRLGERRFAIAPHSLARRVYGCGTARERMHHRYGLAPQFVAPLQATGLLASGTSEGSAITDVVEARDHPFYLGIQGHPELSSSAGRPHPAFVALLAAACRP